MTISDVSSTPQQAATGGQGGLNGDAKLADDFDTFLGLLVTQLENQDPLDPMKANEFTNQLVQFSSVEQAIATNDKLDQMLQAQSGNRATQAVNFIGKTIEMNGSQVALKDGEATFGYTLEDQAAGGALLVTDQTGETVKTVPIDTDSGKHTYTWDGSTDAGGTAADGVYNIQVRAVDEDKKTVQATTQTRGEVTGFEIRDGEIYLNVDDLEVQFDQVTAVHNNTGETSS